jgi:hypothetical protein
VSKFPEPLGVAALRDIASQTFVLPTDTKLTRIYFATGPTHRAGISFAASVLRPHAGTITCQTRAAQASNKSERSTTAHQMLTLVQQKSSSQHAASTELAMLLGSLSLHFAKPSPCWIYAGHLRRKWELPRRYIPGLAPDRALNDDMLVEVLQQIALRLSYGLR